MQPREARNLFSNSEGGHAPALEHSYKPHPPYGKELYYLKLKVDIKLKNTSCFCNQTRWSIARSYVCSEIPTTITSWSWTKVGPLHLQLHSRSHTMMAMDQGAKLYCNTWTTSNPSFLPIQADGKASALMMKVDIKNPFTSDQKADNLFLGMFRNTHF